jgi:sec-independent protein translocase protein TatC
MSEVVQVSENRKNPNKEMTLVEHLDELRRRLFRSIIAVLIFSTIAFLFKDLIFDNIILSPREPDFITNALMCKLAGIFSMPSLCINTESFNIINILLAGQFKAHLLVSFVIGLMLAFPYLIYQIWEFVKPALGKKEIKNINLTLFSVSILFAIGVLFGYFIIIPLTINFLSTYTVSTAITNQISFSSYLSILTGIALATGIVFELPVLIYFLSKIGIVTPQLLRKYRKHAIVVFFILSGIITPPDVFSQVLVAIPLYFLYEISIIISKKVYRQHLMTYGED